MLLLALYHGNLQGACQLSCSSTIKRFIVRVESYRVSPRVLLIIPAYNEEANIARVVGALKSDYPQYDYVVVNDGSKDETATVCREHGFRFLAVSYTPLLTMLAPLCSHILPMMPILISS